MKTSELVFNKLKNKWEREEILSSNNYASEDEILSFIKYEDLIIPTDLVHYFKMINGMSDQSDLKLFEFYPFYKFVPILEKYKNWEGIPYYKDIEHNIEHPHQCFVFADYMMNTFSYSIRLHKSDVKINEVYIVCGGEYKIIADSFTEFLNLYLDDSESLYFN